MTRRPCFGLLALVGVVLLRHRRRPAMGEPHRRRRRPLPLAVLVAFILMAEAMIAVAFQPNLARHVVGVARAHGGGVRRHPRRRQGGVPA